MMMIDMMMIHMMMIDMMMIHMMMIDMMMLQYFNTHLPTMQSIRIPFLPPLSHLMIAIKKITWKLVFVMIMIMMTII